MIVTTQISKLAISEPAPFRTRLAAHHLGLVLTAREPKRAVQFGSRIAKMENRKEKAGDIAHRSGQTLSPRGLPDSLTA